MTSVSSGFYYFFIYVIKKNNWKSTIYLPSFKGLGHDVE